MEVQQMKLGVYRVKRFARNGQLLGEEVKELPEVAGANAVYAQDKPPADGPQTN